MSPYPDNATQPPVNETPCLASVFAVQGIFFSLPNVNITQNKVRSGLGPSNADYRAPFVTE